MKQTKIIAQTPQLSELQMMEGEMFAVFQTLSKAFNKEKEKPEGDRNITLMNALVNSMANATKAMATARKQDINEEMNGSMMQQNYIASLHQMPIGFTAEGWSEKYKQSSDIKAQVKAQKEAMIAEQQAAMEALQAAQSSEFNKSASKSDAKDVLDTSDNEQTENGFVIPTREQTKKITKGL